jgi:hypothetical protein
MEVNESTHSIKTDNKEKTPVVSENVSVDETQAKRL